MAFCPQCGTSVASNDRFCGNCGAAQPTAAGTASSFGGATAWQESVTANLSPQNASVICYIPWVGWIAAIFVLAAERFRAMRDVRFHAFQGMYLSVTWLLIDLLAREIVPRSWMLGQALKISIVVCWVYMLVQTANGRMVKLPVIGEMADRSVDEQK